MKSFENPSTPPTAQTPGPNWLIFWRETPHVNSFRLTEAIFEFHLRSRDIGKKSSILARFWAPSKTPKCAHISALRTKFKNRLGYSETIHMRGLLPKNEPIRSRRMGCRGGAQISRLFTLYFNRFCNMCPTFRKEPEAIAGFSLVT